MAAVKRRLFFIKIIRMEKHFEQVATHFSNFDNLDNYEEEPSFFDEPDNLFGLGKKARRKREIRKSRGEMIQYMELGKIQIERDANDMAVKQSAIALQNVEANKPLISSYVQNAGQVPQQNPAALALQATEVFQNNVAQRQAAGVPDYEQASEAEMNRNDGDWYQENGDQFFGSIIASVFKGGTALVENINEKRTSQTPPKKPLFAGKNWQRLAQKYKDNEGVVDEALTANERAFLALTVKENAKASGIGAGIDGIKNYQTQEALKKYLPYAIILLVVVFFIGKKSA